MRLSSFIACFLFVVVTAPGGLAQGVDTGRSAVALGEAQWQRVEGFYQNDGNKKLYLSFTRRGDRLVATFLWDKSTTEFLPESNSVFLRVESGEGGEPVHIRFDMGTAGLAGSVRMGNGTVWHRVEKYTPVVKKMMPHTVRDLEPYAGLYRDEQSVRYYEFRAKGDSLLLRQDWNNFEFGFAPEAEGEFFTPTSTLFTVKFIKGDAGRVDRAVAFGEITWIRCAPLSLSREQLQDLTGIYKAENDPDNQIRVEYEDNRVERHDTGLVIVQLWDGKRVPVKALANDFFYNAEQAFPVEMRPDADGRVRRVLLLTNQWFVR